MKPPRTGSRAVPARHDGVNVASCVLRRLESAMRVLAMFLLWCLLFTLSWPLALVALVAWPVVWLLSLPLRLVGIGIEAAFALVKAVLFLPARLLGPRT